MKRLVSVLAGLVAGLFILSSFSFAQHQHGGGAKGESMKMESKDVLVEGVKVSFQVMANGEHQKMLKDMKMKEDIEPGTTHNVTVILRDEKTQKELTNAQISMKVVDPKGKDQVKPLKYEDMMKSYDAYFNLSEKGKYQIMILFKVGDQKKTAGVYWDLM
ncbi:MAG TPA: hypothetical protein VLK23_03985 [Thermodesulfobacteriota bacterium]|nr:hypothetical protein [Thermodesulfobacteriota bacterium]